MGGRSTDLQSALRGQTPSHNAVKSGPTQYRWQSAAKDKAFDLTFGSHPNTWSVKAVKG